MPKVTGKVIRVLPNVKGRNLCGLEVHGDLPRLGETVSLKWGSVRTGHQNALYWAYLRWLIDEAGLKDHGHFFPEALHDNLKQHILATNKQELKEGVTTTDLTKAEFSAYVDKVDKFIQEFFEINTAPFWDDYDSNIEGDVRTI